MAQKPVDLEHTVNHQSPVNISSSVQQSSDQSESEQHRSACFNSTHSILGSQTSSLVLPDVDEATGGVASLDHSIAVQVHDLLSADNDRDNATNDSNAVNDTHISLDAAVNAHIPTLLCTTDVSEFVGDSASKKRLHDSNHQQQQRLHEHPLIISGNLNNNNHMVTKLVSTQLSNQLVVNSVNEFKRSISSATESVTSLNRSPRNNQSRGSDSDSDTSDSSANFAVVLAKAPKKKGRKTTARLKRTLSAPKSSVVATQSPDDQFNHAAVSENEASYVVIPPVRARVRRIAHHPAFLGTDGTGSIGEAADQDEMDRYEESNQMEYAFKIRKGERVTLPVNLEAKGAKKKRSKTQVWLTSLSNCHAPLPFYLSPSQTV